LLVPGDRDVGQPAQPGEPECLRHAVRWRDQEYLATAVAEPPGVLSKRLAGSQAEELCPAEVEVKGVSRPGHGGLQDGDQHGLEAWDDADDARRVGNRTTNVGQDWAIERPLLRPLPDEPFDTTLTLTPRVDRYAQVMARRELTAPVPDQSPGHARSAACADDESGASRSSWSQSSSALGAHEEVERGRPETVALPDRLQPACQKVLERNPGSGVGSGLRCS
jgi:hypothetical protein